MSKNIQRRDAETQREISLVQEALDTFEVPKHLRGSRREYFKMGAASMAKHIAYHVAFGPPRLRAYAVNIPAPK